MDNCSMGMANNVKHTSINEHQIWLWHRRLGHPSFLYLKHLFLSMFSQVNEAMFKCEICIQAKSYRASFSLSLNKSNNILFSLIHADVLGPAPHSDGSRKKWFVTFLDDCTWMTWLYLMKNKNKVFHIFQVFHRMVQTQFSTIIWVFCSDNGRKYINQEFQQYFQKHGLQHETSYPYTPQWNGISEWKNRYILNVSDMY